jgi:WD40 repeat protein
MAAAISPDGRILATGADDARVKPWDIDHDKLIDTLGGQRNAYNLVVISPDGRRIAAGGDDGTIRIWDSETHPGVAVLRAHKRYVRSMAFLPDETPLVSGSFDALRGWRAPALKQIESAEKLEALQSAERAREEGVVTQWLVLAPIS